MNQGCNPSPAEGAATAISDADLCATLPQLRAAFYTLLAGSQTSRVRFGEHEIVYSKGDAKTLQSEIRRLETICAPCGGTARAIRAGGYRGHGIPPRRFTSFY